MTRTVKAHEYEKKRGQILDAAQRLIYTRGYAQLTIQDVLDELQISKGAFYHYFDSKQSLLEALALRLAEEVEALCAAIVRATHVPALTRLQQFFDAAGRWKTARRDYLLELLRAWYADDNALVRLHGQALSERRIVPLLAALIADGAREGALSTPFPDEAAAIAQALLTSMGDRFAHLLLSDLPRAEARARAERLVAAHNDALERVLGAPPGSLHLIDPATLQCWFAEPRAAGPLAEEVLP